MGVPRTHFLLPDMLQQKVKLHLPTQVQKKPPPHWQKNPSKLSNLLLKAAIQASDKSQATIPLVSETALQNRLLTQASHTREWSFYVCVGLYSGCKAWKNFLRPQQGIHILDHHLSKDRTAVLFRLLLGPLGLCDPQS